MNYLIPILLLYVFVAIGFGWKKFLSPTQSGRDLSTLSLYFLGPGMVFWGFSTQSLSLDVLWTALYFGVLAILLLGIALLISWGFGFRLGQKAGYTMTTILLNTGNLGMPLGMALIGPESLPYTGAVNMVSVILSSTFGVFYYSRGNFNIKDSLLNILKLPILWMGSLAITLNVFGVSIPTVGQDFLEIFGHMAIGVQLTILGVFLAENFDQRHFGTVFKVGLLTRILIFPILAWLMILIFSLKGVVAQVILLQSLMPSAIVNLNLASYYKCTPERVVPIVFWGHIIAIVTVPFGFWLFG